MKEEKDIQPIDKLFRQSLEGYSPAPPASVWKGIRVKKISRNLSSGKWVTGPGGLSVISAVVLVALSWIIYKSFTSEPEQTQKKSSLKSAVIDSTVADQLDSKIPEPYYSKTKTDSQVNSALGIDKETKNNQDPKNTDKAKIGIVKPIGEKADNAIKQQKTNPVDGKNAVMKSSSSAKLSSTQQVELKSPVTNENTNIVSIEGEEFSRDIDNTAKQGSEVKGTYNEGANETESVGSVIENPSNKPGDSIQQFAAKRENAPSDLSKPSAAKPGLIRTDSVSKTINPLEANNSKSPVYGNANITQDSRPTMSKNLVWQIGLGGNIGQVYQKDRNANFFYGGLITGGLWNTKWKAGIETGIGLSKYKDYGSIGNSWMTSDSIIVTDTIWHQQDSLIYFELIDSTIYFPVAHDETLNYNYSYTYLQVPFFITKQVATFGKFSFDIKAGPVVGFMISKKESVTGSMPPNNVIVSVVNKNYTRLDVSWQLHIAPQLRWDITEKLSINISPAAVLFLNNLYDKKNRPSSKPYGLSIYGGVTYKFK
jgi:hypothetical protein